MVSQGFLFDIIVVMFNNGNILNNGDQVNLLENGFFINNGGNKKYFFIGDQNDLSNNGGLFGDMFYSWDIGLVVLNQKLIFGGVYYQMVMVFDFSNLQNNMVNLLVWVLVIFCDVDGNLVNCYFEIQVLDINDIFKDLLFYQFNKIFDGSGVMMLGVGDFVIIYGLICVVNVMVFYFLFDGVSCLSGGSFVNINCLLSEVEFIEYLFILDL